MPKGIPEYPLPVTGYWLFSLKTRYRHNAAWKPPTVMEALFYGEFWLMFENIFRKEEVVSTHRAIALLTEPGYLRFAGLMQIGKALKNQIDKNLPALDKDFIRSISTDHQQRVVFISKIVANLNHSHWI